MKQGKRILLIGTLSSLSHADLVYLAKSIGPELHGSGNGFETVSNEFSQDYQRSSRPLDDALDEHVPIGFAFPFNGNTYTEVIISSNGVLYFRAFDNNSQRSVAAHYVNQQLNTNSGNNYAMPNAIYAYWDDLNPYAGGKIKYGTVGSGAGEHFVVWWDDVPQFYNSGSYSFQVALYKDGTIKIRYKDSNDNDTDGSSATIGIKEDSNHYDENTYNTSNIDKSRDIVYRPYRHLSAITPLCPSPVNKISMRTYDTSGYNSYPKDQYEYATLVQNYGDASHYDGSGYQDAIDGSGNPYGANDNYLSIFEGYIYLPDTGDYRFGVDGGDAVEVYLDDRLITGWYRGHGRHNRSEYTIKTYAEAGWHKITYHHQKRTGGDNYYLYWQRPGGSLEKVPASQFFHCRPKVTKTSCVIRDPFNSTNNPKRIPSSTIRYAVQVQNRDFIPITDSIVTDNVNGHFDTAMITNHRIGNGSCNCPNPGSTSPNGPNRTGDGVNPVKLDLGTIPPMQTKCRYFEVNLK